MDDLHLLPFAGRTQAFSQLQQHLTNPANTPPVTFIGRRHIGKSAFLQECALLANTIGVYIPLRQTTLRDETTWLNTLAQHMLDAAATHDAIPALLDNPSDDDLREWLIEECLPALFRVARPYRRFLLLLDDIDEIKAAITAGTLPPDTFEFLYSLLQPQLGIALSLDLEHEETLDQYMPLISTDAIHRLSNLTLEDIMQLTGTDAEVVYKATNGIPPLVQAFIGLPDAKAAIPHIYNQYENELELAWRGLNRDERLVLTALSSLIYADPVGKIDTNRIESWMVETDYLLDSTAINAAIRGLEYRELVTGTTSNITISAGLMQKWLLEHALLTPSEQPGTVERLRPVLMIGLLILVIVLIAILLTTTGGDTESVTVPTITLLPGSS